MSQWSFAFQWLVEGAIVSLAISGLGSAVVLLSSQPARRIHVITLTMIGCLAATLVGGIPGLPRWSLPWSRAGVAPAALRSQAEVPAVSGSRPIMSASDQRRQPASAAAVRSPEGHLARHQRTASRVATGGGEAPAAAIVGEESSEAASGIKRHSVWSVHAPRLLVVLYLMGVLVMAAGWLVGMVWLYRVLRRARVANWRVQRVWRQVAGPNARPVRLLVSEELGQPIAFHLRRPTVVLPEVMEADADEQALRWCLAHEQSHLEKGDWWIWTLSGLVRIVFFFQPLVWWLRRQLQLDQDYLADARAAEQSPEPEDYAEFLTSRASQPLLRPAIAGLGIGGRKSNLTRRVIMLLKSEKTLEGRCPRIWRLGALVAGLLVVGAVGTFGGVFGQDEKTESTESRLGAVDADKGVSDSAFARISAHYRTTEFNWPESPKSSEGLLDSEDSSLDVRLVDAATGKPFSYGGVELTRTDDRKSPPERLLASLSGDVFKFADLPPGRYCLHASVRSLHPDEPRYVADQDAPEVEIVAGEDKEITVRMRAVPLAKDEIAKRWPYVTTGTVTDNQGKPMEGVDIYVYVGTHGTIQGWRGATTDAQGNYTLRYSGRSTGLRPSTPPLLQGGSFRAWKDGYVEKNLNRHAGVIVARRTPQEQDWEQYTYLRKDPSRVVLPNEPRRVDFVMIPEVAIDGQLVDGQDVPLSRKRLRMTGNLFRPQADGIAVDFTDDQGRFRLERIPPGKSWWIVHKYDRRKEARSRTIAFERPGEYRLKLRLVIDTEIGIAAMEIVNLTDPEGKEIRQATRTEKGDNSN